MPWIEPITDWGDGDYYTYHDWNRVVVDADILIPLGNLDEYMASSNDFLSYNAWNDVKSQLLQRALSYGLDVAEPSNEMTADSFNAMEMLLVVIKRHEDWIARQQDAMRYVGQDIYAAHAGEYTDISEEYVRD